MSFVTSFYASSVVNAMKIPLVCQKKKKKKQWKGVAPTCSWELGPLAI